LPAISDKAPPLDLNRSVYLDWRNALVIMLTILAGLALTWVLWQVIRPIQHTLLLFGLAAALAFAFSGPVDALTRRPGDRAIATVVAYALFGALVLGGVALLAGPFVAQASDLTSALPIYANGLRSDLSEAQARLGEYGMRTIADQFETRATSAAEQAAESVLTNLAATVGEASGWVTDVMLTLVISVYLLIDGPRFAERAMTFLPRRHRTKALFIQEHAVRVLGSYIRGQLTLAVLVGVAAWIGTAALGLPYAVVLGVLAGLFELVPMFGSVLSAVPAIIVALFMPFPTVVWIIVLFMVIGQVENNILEPRILGDAVGLHPLAAMFALLAGYQVAGPLGAVFAVPLAALVWVVLGAAYADMTGDAR
jgi:predicted PurR-regulated permease PerM